MKIVGIWSFPEIGVPPAIIHFRLGFPIVNQPFWGHRIYGNLNLLEMESFFVLCHAQNYTTFPNLCCCMFLLIYKC